MKDEDEDEEEEEENRLRRRSTWRESKFTRADKLVFFLKLRLFRMT